MKALAPLAPFRPVYRILEKLPSDILSAITMLDQNETQRRTGEGVFSKWPTFCLVYPIGPRDFFVRLGMF